MSLTIRLGAMALNLNIDNFRNYNDYDFANRVSLIVNPFFYLLSDLLIQKFKDTKKFLRFVQVISLAFSLFLIFCGMRITFFSMHNPRNTLVMYMISLIVTALLYTYEYYETVFLCIVTALTFSALLPHYQQSIIEITLNEFACFVLLTVFFCISRYSFSYRSDQFLKLKAIEQKNLEIKNANHLKDEILGVVAHDLRNPLAAIESITMLMEMDEGIDADNRENLQMIKSSCKKARYIINDLLEAARNEIENDFKVEKVDINGYLAHIVDVWMVNNKNSINIIYSGPKQPVFALINKEKIQRVMDNLISNAIKFSGESDKIEIMLKVAGGKILIGVKDYGLGIPNNLLPHIFERFSKAGRKGLRGEESFGLGLSIVQQIVLKHGGEIDVESVEMKGTTFTIKIPQASNV